MKVVNKVNEKKRELQPFPVNHSEKKADKGALNFILESLVFFID